QLPPDLFFGTGIATCIIVLAKSKRDNSVFFIDASTWFERDGNKNKLKPEHRDRIVDLFEAREDVDYVAKLVSNEEILANDAGLSVSAYVEKEDTREKIDIAQLNAEIAGIVERQVRLRTEIDPIVADLEGGEATVQAQSRAGGGGRHAAPVAPDSRPTTETEEGAR